MCMESKETCGRYNSRVCAAFPINSLTSGSAPGGQLGEEAAGGEEGAGGEVTRGEGDIWGRRQLGEEIAEGREIAGGGDSWGEAGVGRGSWVEETAGGGGSWSERQMGKEDS